MSRRDIGTDDPRVRVRPGKGSRPRTKIRPDYSSARRGRLLRIDRGRYLVRMLDDGTEVTAVKARELGRGKLAIGDVVAMVGDLSGRKDTLARIASIDERTTILRRTAEEGEASGTERIIVANADQLLIVTALAQPEPRPGMIDRCLVAAYDAGMTPILMLTKADLGDADELLALYEPLDLRILISSTAPDNPHADLHAVREALTGHVSVLVGHSGVGKSTLLNALVEGAGRQTGHVNDVTGRGRHTSTSAMAFDFPGGAIIDTPGVRTFGLAHVGHADLLRGFPDLEQIADQLCPRGCSHEEGALDCALSEVSDPRLITRVASFRRLLQAKTEND
ncbi:ribosome small subunit-dependent GTPase A [Arcanobacterium canis]